jgi:hypothetical protein
LLEGLPLQHGRFLKPDLSRLLPAAYHFNPSLTKWNGALWIAYRYVTPVEGVSLFEWRREFAVCRLRGDLEPVPESNAEVSVRIGNDGGRRWFADPRFFLREAGSWISYHDDKDLYVFPIDLERLPARFSPKRLVLVDRPPRAGERNWGFFDDGVFKAVYSIRPHIILKLEETEEAVEAFSFCNTEAQIPWNVKHWGEPHGGSSPVRVGSCWFSFFQSSSRVNRWSERKVYRLGFYGFEDKPPYRIRCMTREPILGADSIDGPRSYYRDHAVVFPSGALFEDGWWLVSLGIHDRTLAFTVFEHKRLLENCATF